MDRQPSASLLFRGRQHPLSGSSSSPPVSRHRCPWPCPPGQNGLQASHLVPLDVERHVYQHSQLVQRLPALQVTRQHKVPLEPIEVPSRRFSHNHVDLAGALPSCSSVNHLLTVIDRSTWLEAIHPQSIKGPTVTDTLVPGWIARFGVPADLTFDHGVQLSSEV